MADISNAPRGRAYSARNLPGFGIIAMATFVLIYAPIIILVVYSFNEGTSLATWEGFSLRWYAQAAANAQVQSAALRSLYLAGVAATVATIAATMAALATTRSRRFPGKTMIYALINQPLMVPEIVTAVALLIVFAWIKVATGYTGMIYLIAAHTAFCIPFAYLPIRARLETMDMTLEVAASDLYASKARVFTKITLPLLMPGIIAGYMLAFVISLDDVVITEFVKSAGQDTLPTYMLGQLRRVVTPEVNAISTAILLAGAILVSLFFWFSRGRE
ncbi:MAG: spermidine/putrescine ABC transporter permease PotC [Rhodobacteraceae bacterium]|nr:spermidine/putrescine ABC transporter permease PotC [Paracoccaceae bacterium]MAY45875.1 spermidine/putrescine ABC transporter permease PotC [Paracoccaceae bacterium]QEW18360.1 Inner membrane ABC transporter permease protein [Marinibacterium anthonyi]